MTTLVPAKQRAFALEVVEQLRSAGYLAYWAGGCVRDHLLHRTPKDYDVATDAPPADIVRVFGHRKSLEIGAAFGVVAIVGPHGAGTVEVATFRSDLAYTDGRRPDSVAFSTPEEDAQRRDFTINGLFLDPVAERVIDYVGGIADLEQGLVRAIGNPHERFTEDKLRLLRAVRMAATFRFELDTSTLVAVQAMADQVIAVSPERIAQELRLLLVLPRAAAGVVLLDDARLLPVLLPELAALRRHSDGRWDQTLRVLDELFQPEFPLALAAAIHGIDRPEALVRELHRRWRLSNQETNLAGWLVMHASELADAQRRPWSQVQRLLAAPGGRELVDLAEAIAKATHASLDGVLFCREKLTLPRDQLDPPRLVTGDDLLAHGLARGQHFSVLLERLRSAQLDGLIADKEAGLRLVEQWLAEGA